MKEEQNHFIKNIEIKNFKCFENFSAEGFGRVNLIGGKNNVGKTAFMEACYLAEIENKNTPEFIEKSIIIELHRDSINFLINWLNNFKTFKLKYINSQILINDTFLPLELNCTYGNIKGGNIWLSAKKANDLIKNSWAKELINYDQKIIIQNPNTYSENIEVEKLEKFYLEGKAPLVNNKSFISVGNDYNNYIVNLIDEIKLSNHEDLLNSFLIDLFNIQKIDIIKHKVMLKVNNKYLFLNEYGDGIKHFLNIILALLLNQNTILYLDEIENGIHYSNLDKLWEIILTISKEQNVQVFATTHSKECIESYARVAKKLEDEEIGFIELGRNKKNELDAIVMDSEMFQRFIKLGNEVRGW